MELQEFEDRATLRIKFASLRGQGPHHVPDALDEYRGFFDELPAGWSLTEEGVVESVHEHTRRAWRLSSQEGDVVAVEHETGLELVVIAVGLAETATKLASWAWKQRREESKPGRSQYGPAGEDAVVFERTSRALDGTVTQNRVTIPADRVTDELILSFASGSGSPTS